MKINHFSTFMGCGFRVVGCEQLIRSPLNHCKSSEIGFESPSIQIESLSIHRESSEIGFLPASAPVNLQLTTVNQKSLNFAKLLPFELLSSPHHSSNPLRDAFA